MTALPISGFSDAFVVTVGDNEMQVYSRGDGNRCVVVMHELPGMSESFISYCKRLADEGYKVYMPLLFKKPGTNMNALMSAAFCLTREFGRLFSAPSPGANLPITELLEITIENVVERHQNAKVGVIGMCLTGGFALGAIANDRVKAAVACQPSFPFFSQIKTLGFSPSQISCIKERAARETGTLAKGYRYSKDVISRESHMKAAEALLGERFDRHPDLPGRKHSTLTGKSFSQEVYDDCLSFLEEKLG